MYNEFEKKRSELLHIIAKKEEELMCCLSMGKNGRYSDETASRLSSMVINNVALTDPKAVEQRPEAIVCVAEELVSECDAMLRSKRGRCRHLTDPPDFLELRADPRFIMPAILDLSEILADCVDDGGNADMIKEIKCYISARDGFAELRFVIADKLLVKSFEAVLKGGIENDKDKINDIRLRAGRLLAELNGGNIRGSYTEGSAEFVLALPMG